MATISYKTITQTITLGAVGTYPTYASPLTIADSGAVVTAPSVAAIYGPASVTFATIVNFGTISGSSGIVLSTGGRVDNAGTAASISGGFNNFLGNHQRGVRIFGDIGTVTNRGTISGYGAVDLEAGGRVINGLSGATAAYLQGLQGVMVANGLGTVINYGTIGGQLEGVNLYAGGLVTNSGTAALIGTRPASASSTGVSISGGLGTVINQGTIQGYHRDGVGLSNGGLVINGASGATAAHIDGGNGVVLYGGGTVVNNATISGSDQGIRLFDSGTVLNYGRIAGYRGINLVAGGVVKNGTSGQTAAVIAGTVSGGLLGAGVYLGFHGGPSTVTNYGTISGVDFGVYGNTAAGTGSIGNYGTISGGKDAIRLQVNGGNVTNRARGTITAGTIGIDIGGAPGTLANYGTISAFHSGVYMHAGGTVTNSGTAALITATPPSLADFNGVRIEGGLGTVFNQGTIQGYNGNGVVVENGGLVVNGASGATAARIEGAALAVALYAGGTVVNAATIWGHSNFGIMLKARGTALNYGRILGLRAVALAAGGVVKNGASGHTGAVIEGSVISLVTRSVGIYLVGPSSVANYGTISAVNFGVYFPFTTAAGNGNIGNYGTIIAGEDAILLKSNGGTVTNGASGAVTAMVSAASIGIHIGGAPGSVINYGTIIGAYAAIALRAGGTVGNLGSAARISVPKVPEDRGIFGLYGSVTVTNQGTITGYKSIQLLAGGTVTNGAPGFTSAYIGGGNRGILIGGGPETVINYGTIKSGTAAIYLATGGRVDNIGGAASISVSTGYGIVIARFAGTITNTGTMGAVQLRAGGTITNGSATATAAYLTGVYVYGSAGTVSNFGTINAGVFGVSLGSGGTVVNAGVISGPTAVSFGTGGALLVLGHGYSLQGSVAGFAGASNTLELAGSIGAAVTANYNALSLSNFGTVAFAAGAGNYATLKITNDAVLPKLIVGFNGPHDIIDLAAIGSDGTITNNDTINHTVTLTGSGGSVTLQFDASSASNFATIPDGASGTDLVVACFRRGTRILTPAGEVAVEALTIGDRVATLSGMPRPIKWIGRRAYDRRFIAGNRTVLPVRIIAGALADGVPARDLWLSPEHALFIDGTLAAARLLINGTSIVQDVAVADLEYFHLELDGHDIIVAEGVAAESYVECDNRGMFANAGEFALLYPDERPQPAQFCAPRPGAGSAAIRTIRAALASRVAALIPPQAA